MKVQSRLKELREEKKLTQGELAKLTGLARQSISNWEIDFSNIRICNVITLADFFSVSIDYLVERKPVSISKEELAILLKNADVEKLVNLLIEAQKKNQDK